jgi:hypothetical protein
VAAARAMRAGLAYFGVVFAAGFVLGTLGVTVLAPAVGDFTAVLLELPFMIGISWLACASLVRRLAVPPETTSRVKMGGVAFLCLIAAELALSAAAFGRGPGAFATDLTRPAGAAGLAGQVLFALFPWLQARRS